LDIAHAKLKTHWQLNVFKIYRYKHLLSIKCEVDFIADIL